MSPELATNDKKDINFTKSITLKILMNDIVDTSKQTQRNRPKDKLINSRCLTYALMNSRQA